MEFHGDFVAGGINTETQRHGVSRRFGEAGGINTETRRHGVSRRVVAGGVYTETQRHRDMEFHGELVWSAR